MVYVTTNGAASDQHMLHNIPDAPNAEIKQEDELIIEDTDSGNIQWCFINTLDLNEDDDFSSGPKHTATVLNRSHDDIIEISDDDVDGDDDDNCERVYINNTPMLDIHPDIETSEIDIINEPIQEISFCLESNEDNKMETSSLLEKEETLPSESMPKCEDTIVKAKLESDAKEFLDEEVPLLNRRNRRSLVQTKIPGPINNDSDIVAVAKELLAQKCMKIKCNICSETFSYSTYTWIKHIRDIHHDMHMEILSNYRFQDGQNAICRVCKIKISCQTNHLIHYFFHHSKDVPKLFMCSSCDLVETSVFDLKKHQAVHSLTTKDIKPVTPLKLVANCDKAMNECPKCGKGFKNSGSLEFHFFSSHLRDFWAKFQYSCHLCDKEDASKNHGSSRKNYYEHLINHHKLNNWKRLKFRKFDNGHHLQCIECLRIFTQTNDIKKLVSHYLCHEATCLWTCRYCRGTYRFQDWPSLHMCNAMKYAFQTKKPLIKQESNEEMNKTIKEENVEENKASIKKLLSFEEFEAYIWHVCPFCNEKFNKFEQWRLHIREIHHINSLEGLNMNIIADEAEMLQCLECFEKIPKNPIELHKHRFQHLPFLPYKCRHCPKSLETYSLAFIHVSQQCVDPAAKLSDSKDSFVQIHEAKLPKPSVEYTSVESCIHFSCHFCPNKRFPLFSDISMHFSTVHDHFRQYFSKCSAKENHMVCKICQADVNSNRSCYLMEHYFSHLDEKPFRCRKCHRSYPSYSTTSRHVKDYHQECVAVTTKVEKSNNKIERNEDNRNITPTKIKIKTEKEVSPLMQDRKPNCSKSAKPVETEKGNKPDEAVVKNEKTEGEVSAELELESEFSFFDYRAKLYKKYSKFITFACPECNASFSTMTRWEIHIRIQHSFFDTKNFFTSDPKSGDLKCIECNTTHPDKASAQRRHILSHLAHTSFVCALCPSRFTQLNTLYRHLERVHFATARLKCPLCPKISNTPYARSEHMKASHSSKDWPESVCLMCFNTVENMDYHIKMHHANRTKLTVCKICGLSFKQKLEEHMKTKHKKHRRKTTTKQQEQKENATTSTVSTTVTGKKRPSSLQEANKSNSKRQCLSNDLKVNSSTSKLNKN